MTPMSKWLLDTNVVIRLLNGMSSELARRVREVPVEDLCICSIVKAELEYGAAKSRDPDMSRKLQFAFTGRLLSLPFDDAAAAVAGRLRADLAKRGTPIGLHDLQIAAIAIAHDVVLVSHNTHEFQRVPGLQLEDWE